MTDVEARVFDAPIHTVLFDLDGTLTDSKAGITRGVQRGLRVAGIEVEDLDTLVGYIGPPIEESFVALHGVGDEHLDACVEAFRSYYREVGLFENELYPATVELLAAVAALDGVTVALATAKLDVTAVRILEHFGLQSSFAFVGGANREDRRTKTAIVAHVLDALGIDGAAARAGVVIVGDREHDIEAAHANGIRSIAVTWGYAAPGELEASGADLLTADPLAVVAAIASSRR